jgi:hypothetical protein
MGRKKGGKNQEMSWSEFIKKLDAGMKKIGVPDESMREQIERNRVLYENKRNAGMSKCGIALDEFLFDKADIDNIRSARMK